MASRLRLFAVWVEMLELPLIPRCVAGSALLGALLAGACGGPPGPTPLSILDTNVFESETGNFVPGQTVVVWEGRVVEVAPSEQSRREGAGEVLDGTGRFLIPGLVDAHIHLTHVLYQAGMTGDGILPLCVVKTGSVTARAVLRADNPQTLEATRSSTLREGPDEPRLRLGFGGCGDRRPLGLQSRPKDLSSALRCWQRRCGWQQRRRRRTNVLHCFAPGVAMPQSA